MTTIANWSSILILVVIVGLIGLCDNKEPKQKKKTIKPKDKDNSYHILPSILGVLVCVIIGVAIGKAVLDSTTDCFEYIAEKYPTAECGFGESVYCEYQNKTYKVLQSWSEQNGTTCYFEGMT